ncbi:unnamed protein product [Microthlaspi erraticum]|uniref:Uncharacterized protein n=1 Tax=Microthlaspi erraticum TaxID=1685480 RepID=A0A6D2HNY2_9BRAS|nr:unnamed protein product [Microthlaspi erraticum]
MSKAEAKINREMMMLAKDQAPRIRASLGESKEERKLIIVGTKPYIPDLNAEPCFDSEGEEKEETEDNHIAPRLSKEHQLEIFLRASYFEYSKLQFFNKKLSHLLGVLPELPMHDYCFVHSDKETICAGAQLIVVGRELEGIVVWRYELENNKWFKGPAMITPRVMYGSASRGTDAFFAGGINEVYQAVNIAEKYNADTKTWTVIREMHKKRKFSSGFFLCGKFYVIGGRDENNENLTCGERYDDETNSWELIPDMLKDMAFTSSHSPPLIAVVDNNLYLMENSVSELRVYDRNTNVWKKLGVVPVEANITLGWGVAFKSIGDRLLVIGPSSSQSYYRRTVVYTCRPSPKVEEQIWEELKDCCDIAYYHQYILNCSVMFA